MSDERGLQLPDEILQDLPEIPASLEYLKWDIGERGSLYKLESSGGQVRAVKCDALRKHDDKESWTEGRVLEY
jgi:hypothetical protein